MEQSKSQIFQMSRFDTVKDQIWTQCRDNETAWNRIKDALYPFMPYCEANPIHEIDVLLKQLRKVWNETVKCLQQEGLA